MNLPPAQRQQPSSRGSQDGFTQQRGRLYLPATEKGSSHRMSSRNGLSQVKSVKSRAEAAVGENKESKILEAGGGKKANEEQASKIVEAGGGKKITKEAKHL